MWRSCDLPRGTSLCAAAAAAAAAAARAVHTHRSARRALRAAAVAQATVLFVVVWLLCIGVPAMAALAVGTSINVAARMDVTSLLEQTERELWKQQREEGAVGALPHEPRRAADGLLDNSPAAAAATMSPRSPSDAGQLRAFLAQKIIHCDHHESVFGVALQPGIRSGVISAFVSAVLAVALRLEVCLAACGGGGSGGRALVVYRRDDVPHAQAAYAEPCK